MTTEVTVSKGDYIVADYQDKRCLIKVLAVRGESIRGTWEVGSEEHSVEVTLDDVTANLGTTPQIGKVYGCNTERLIDVTTTKPVTTVEWFLNADEDLINEIHAAILSAAKILRKFDIHRILKVVKCRIVQNTAKTLNERSVIGTYQCKSATVDNPDIITIKYHPDMMSQFDRLFIHEVGHGLWNRLMSSSLKAKWIAAFYNQATIWHVDAEETAEALKLAVATRSFIMETDEQTQIIDSVLSYVEQTSGLRRKDLLILMNEDMAMAKRVLSSWRQYPTFSGERDVVVTPYANKSVEELWCESLAVHCTGQILPDYLKDLFKETMEEVGGMDFLGDSE